MHSVTSDAFPSQRMCELRDSPPSQLAAIQAVYVAWGRGRGVRALCSLQYSDFSWDHEEKRGWVRWFADGWLCNPVQGVKDQHLFVRDTHCRHFKVKLYGYEKCCLQILQRFVS